MVLAEEEAEPRFVKGGRAYGRRSLPASSRGGYDVAENRNPSIESGPWYGLDLCYNCTFHMCYYCTCTNTCFKDE